MIVKSGKERIPSEYTGEKYRFWNTMKKILPKYKVRKSLMKAMCMAYNGNGMQVIHKEYHKDRNLRYDSYDINSAYPFALCNYEYPLSERVEIRTGGISYQDLIFEQGLYIALVKIEEPKRVYKKLSYDIFINHHLRKIGNKFCFVGWMTSVDINNFDKLYTFKSIEVAQIIKFRDVGKIKGIEKYIKDYYKYINKFERGSDKRYWLKKIFNTCTYGKMAEKKGSEIARDPHIFIPMFQIAYIRDIMIKILKKTGENTAYIDTDGIKVLAGTKVDLPIGEEFGEFKNEWNNKRIDFVRMRGYFAYNDDGTVLEQCYTGIESELDVKTIDRLMRYEEVKILEERKINGEVKKQLFKIRKDDDNFL